MNVDAIQKGSGNFVAIAEHLVRRAVTTAVVVSQVATDAGTRCSFAIRAHHP